MNQPLRYPPPGHEWALGADNQLHAVRLRPENFAYVQQLGGGLGQHPTDRGGGGVEDDPRWKDWTRVPAFYVVTIELGGEEGDQMAGSVPLRPEPFVCRRITWATTGDVAPIIDSGFAGGSVQGRACTVQWDDEFTKFLGSRPALVSALFGDSQGFLDIPRGVMFQGKQTLSVTLTRLLWPAIETEGVATRWDFVFHGIGLLPPGINQSGAA